MAVDGVEEESLALRVEESWTGCRLDQFLASRLEFSRSLLQDWIKQGRAELEGRAARASSKLKPGQRIVLRVPPLAPAEPQPDPGIPLDVLLEDEHLLVINKQRGLVVHPAPGNPDGTLVNALLAHCRDWPGIGGVERPGIVHRLDKDTSGLMVVAKSDAALTRLQAQFQERTVLKVYLALVWGVPHPRRGRINQPLARHPHDRIRMAVVATGRSAVTDYEVKEVLDSDNALVEVRLHSGRTHQIRVHLSWLGFPLVGDPIYGKRRAFAGLSGQALHSWTLGFEHPILGRRLELTAPPPADFEGARIALGGVPAGREQA
jgi:23S rRNA pseudouridine1911/1915/1917 synthase